MWANDEHMSTSLTKIVLEPDEQGTRLTYAELAVHMDGIDTPEGREAGTRRSARKNSRAKRLDPHAA